MSLKFYNTLTRSLDEFAPMSNGGVKVYCCGPTVYNFQHIGNLRTYVSEDLFVKSLRFLGFDVKHVMNITDVGHLVSDADEGEDKMIVAMRKEGKKSSEIADFYTKVFFDHCQKLNIKKPDVVCKATEHVGEMIEMIKQLIDNGFAYESGGNVYYDVSRFSSYGELARLNLEDLKAGARIEVDQGKRNPYDFALWFTKSKFENQELQWDSPWGVGYPGWHIECSAMCTHHLGDQIDVHWGGIDHIPVHHTNEIAQSEGSSGKSPFSRFWMHAGFLVDAKGKMSKSTGEFLTLDLLESKGHTPLAYRYLTLGTHYRKELQWSFEALSGAENALKRLKKSIEGSITDLTKEDREGILNNLAERKLELSGNSYLTSFIEVISNDLNFAQALALLNKLAADQIEPATKFTLVALFDQVLSLDLLSSEEEVEIPAEIIDLAEQRQLARKERRFVDADKFRAEIIARGYQILETKDGYHVKKG